MDASYGLSAYGRNYQSPRLSTQRSSTSDATSSTSTTKHISNAQGDLYWHPEKPQTLGDLHPSLTLPDNPIKNEGRDVITSWHTVTTTPDASPVKLGLKLECPSWGLIILTPPEEAKIHAQLTGVEPVYDHVLHGRFEMTLPPEVKSIKYKSVRVGFKTIAIWRGNAERSGEVDVLFQRELQAGQNVPKGNIIHGGEK